MERSMIAPVATRLGNLAAAAGERAVAPLGAVVDEVRLQSRSLDEVGHRPWPLPDRPWVMGQTWHQLLFAHWPVEPAAIDRLLPAPLQAQRRDGSAWLGVTPFAVAALRLRGTTPLPWLSWFPELNVRTYVEVDGKPGIYFFSLDAARRTAVASARRTYRLPYFHARMSIERDGDEVRYASRRIDRSAPPVGFRARYGPAGPRTDDPLGRWLAERYCLYVVGERHRVLRADIHHPPWPLQPAHAELELNQMAQPLGLELRGDPLLHYSDRQDTVIWSLAPANGHRGD
jgi:uncharacterized protein YqjF (DUF2071 family)